MQLLIENVNIVNPDEEILTNHNVLIEDKKIKEISTDKINTKGDVEIIDGEDNYLLPGFIDMHTHLMGNGFSKVDYMNNPLSLHFYSAINNGKDIVNSGVTFIRDCGEAELGVKIAQQNGIFIAPKMHISVTPLSCTGGHFDHYMPSGFDMELQIPGVPKGCCDGVEGVTRKTREIKRAGADFIKVMCSGGMLNDVSSPKQAQFNKKELKAIVHEAHLGNLKVAAHCHSLRGMNNCIKAGFSSIEHGTYINHEIAKRMVNKSIYLIPTLCVHKFLIENGFPEEDIYTKDNILKLKEASKVQYENISDAYQVGVKMLMGSDGGSIDHGVALRELQCLVDIGMSEIEAISAGTIEAAKYLRLDDYIGSIKVGKFADMVLVNNNPLNNVEFLSNNDNILKVFQDGQIVKGGY